MKARNPSCYYLPMNTRFPQLTPKHLASPATYFISDLHLSDQAPTITQAFTQFLELTAKSADAIYILGDFFDAWVGDDTPAEFLDSVTTACLKSSEKTKLYLLRGNRDFLISKAIQKSLNIAGIRDPSVISPYGKKILVCHGDHLCTLDKAHQLFRRASSLRWLQRLFLCLPLSRRLNIAGQLGRTGDTTPTPRHDVTPQAVQKAMIKSDCKTLIHGHTHKPCHHTEENRYVLGCWEATATILRLNSDNKYELLQWYPQEASAILSK